MIYIIKFRDYNNPVPKNYKTLYVGKEFKYNYVEDNINKLNPYLNEATGLYDIWKNKKDKIVGLVHYRWMFYNNNEILKWEDAKEILKDYDIIIAPYMKFDKSLYWQLKFEVENSDVLDYYLNELYKVEPEFEEYLNRSEFNNSEMFICNKELIDKYCEWIFPIVVPLAEHFDKTYKGTQVNQRLVGHITERLFAYWIWKNELKCYNMEYKLIESQ